MTKSDLVAQQKAIREQQRLDALLEQQRLAKLRSKINNLEEEILIADIPVASPVPDIAPVEPLALDLPSVEVIKPVEPIVEIDGDSAIEESISEPVSIEPVRKQVSSNTKRSTVVAAKKGGSAVLSDDRKMVRNVHTSAIEMALREFPMANNIGDAISAYLIAHMDERPVMTADLKQLVNDYAEDTVTTKLYGEIGALNTKISHMDATLRATVSVLQELQLGISYLIADRKGLTREQANITMGGNSINLLEDCVPETMARLHEQTRQYLNLQRLSEGRQKK